jgi:hypothetical protein
VAGGAADFAMNIERPTSNAQQRMAASRGIVQRSMFDVRCSMFVFTAILFATLRLFGQASTNLPPRLSPAYPEIPPTFGERFSPTTQSGQAIYISIVLLAVLLFFVIWKKLYPPPPPTLPPEIVAREALAKVPRQPEDGKHLSEVSQILRRYAIAAFELPPGEFTTAEFSAALAGSEKIGAELAQTISNFLRECDGRKFSPASSTVPFQAAARALELIALAEKRRLPAPAQR